MLRAFVSHSSKDQEIVATEVVPFLKQCGIEPWFAPSEINVGDDFERRIKDALKLSSLLVVVVSAASAASKWVRREVAAWDEQTDAPILPICLDETLPSQIDLTLIRRHHIRRSELSDNVTINQIANILAGTASTKPAQVEVEHWNVSPATLRRSDSAFTAADFSSYVQHIAERFHSYPFSEIGIASPERINVEPFCRPLSESGVHQSAEEKAKDWIERNTSEQKPCLVLAEYGMGKSFFSHSLFINAASSFLQTNGGSRLPILYPLRLHNYSRVDADLIDDIEMYMRKYGFPMQADENLASLLNCTKALLILDGFDEMPMVQFERDVLSVLQRFIQKISESCAIVVTSRTGLFLSQLAGSSTFCEWSAALLTPWREQDWRSFVGQCHFALKMFPNHDSYEQFLDHVAKDRHLKELTRTPLYARMLVEARHVILSVQTLSVVQLYETYTKTVLSARPHPALTIDQRLNSLECLALFFFHHRRTDCSQAELVDFAQEYAESTSRAELQACLQHDIQAYSLISPCDDGRFRFSHKSFYEFFFARAITRASVSVGCLYRVQEMKFLLDHGEETFLSLLATPDEFKHIRTFLETPGKPSEAVLRRNLVMLLHLVGQSLEQLQLDGADLSGIDLSNSNLRKTTMNSANCINTVFTHANMCEVSMVRANLDGADISDTDLSRAKLDGAAMTNLRTSGAPPQLTSASLCRLTVSEIDIAYLVKAVRSSKWEKEVQMIETLEVMRKSAIVI